MKILNCVMKNNNYVMDFMTSKTFFMTYRTWTWHSQISPVVLRFCMSWKMFVSWNFMTTWTFFMTCRVLTFLFYVMKFFLYVMKIWKHVMKFSKYVMKFSNCVMKFSKHVMKYSNRVLKFSNRVIKKIFMSWNFQSVSWKILTVS